MMTIISVIGGILVGSTCASFVEELGWTDPRPWLCFIGFCLSVIGIGLS